MPNDGPRVEGQADEVHHHEDDGEAAEEAVHVEQPRRRRLAAERPGWRGRGPRARPGPTRPQATIPADRATYHQTLVAASTTGGGERSRRVVLDEERLDRAGGGDGAVVGDEQGAHPGILDERAPRAGARRSAPPWRGPRPRPPTPATTVTAASPLSAGRPVPGSMRWWAATASRSTTGARALELVVTAPPARRSSARSRPGSKGSSTAMTQSSPPPTVSPPTRTSPPRSTQAPAAPAPRQLVVDEVGRAALADAAEVDVAPGRAARRGRRARRPRCRPGRGPDAAAGARRTRHRAAASSSSKVRS